MIGGLNKNINIVRTRFSNNKARISGGCVYITTYNYYLFIHTCLFDSCDAVYGNGGSIAITETASFIPSSSSSSSSKSNYTINNTIKDISIINSKAKYNGGGIYISNANSVISHYINVIDLKINSSYSLNGAGIYINDKANHIDISNSAIINNNVKANGGAMYISSYTEDINIINSFIGGNSAIKNGMYLSIYLSNLSSILQ
jgi:hypothetical protein